MGESSSRFPTKPADSRTRFARRSDVRAVRRRPASERAGEPSRRDKYDGSDPPEGGGGWYTRWYTGWYTPPSTDRASGQKRGVAPVFSLSAGAVRVSRSRSKNPNNAGVVCGAVVVHPSPLFLVHPPPRPCTISPALRPALRPAPERTRRRAAALRPNTLTASG